MMHLVTYKHRAYTSFIHLNSALVCKENLCNIDIKIVQLHSMPFVSIIVDSVRDIGGSCLLCKSDIEYNTAVIMWPLNF